MISVRYALLATIFFAAAFLATAVPQPAAAGAPLAATVSGTVSSGAVAAGPPQLGAQAAVLMDYETGQVLYGKNMHLRRAPASTTKIMTAILAIESSRLEETVKISRRAASTEGSTMHLYAGQLISLRDLVTGLMLRSGNDAAVAIAEHLAGSVDSFVALMNAKAMLLGARETHFRNPHGLTKPDHYSTAYDLALIGRYAMGNPVFAAIVGSKETTIDWLTPSGREGERRLRNTNKLLWLLEDADGIKTGTTAEAGRCLVASASRDGRRLIAVVLNDYARWQDSARLLEYGFNAFEVRRYAAPGDPIGAVAVERGMTPSIAAVAAAPVVMLIPKSDAGTDTCEIYLPEKITAPVFRGQKLGEIILFLKDQPIQAIDLVAAADVEEKTPARALLSQLIQLLRVMARWGMF